MYINKNKIINSILCGCNAKFPISNSHYICGKDILAFSNIICIENTLTNITSQLKVHVKILQIMGIITL